MPKYKHSNYISYQNQMCTVHYTLYPKCDAKMQSSLITFLIRMFF